MLNDTDPCPFGHQYRGVPMQDVPTSYLHWYWTETTRPNADMNDYIKRSMDALQQEKPDLIWENESYT